MHSSLLSAGARLLPTDQDRLSHDPAPSVYPSVITQRFAVHRAWPIREDYLKFTLTVSAPERAPRPGSGPDGSGSSCGAVRPFLIVMAVSVIATALSVPPIRALSRRVGAMAEPGDRTVHARPTPVLGGTSLLIGVLAGLGVAALLPEFRPVFDTPINVLGIVAAAVVMWLTGLVDDLRDVSAPAKVAGMVLSGSILTLVGLTVIYFRVPFVGFTVLPPDLSALVSVLWVVGMANAVNLIDGLDGLAAGIVTIASGAFFLYGWRLLDVGVLDPSNVGPLVAIVTAGVCLGFLPFNFNPASIFMGDSGALLLGLLLAASTIAVGGQSDDPFSGQSWFFFAPLVIPLFILGVPLLGHGVRHRPACHPSHRGGHGGQGAPPPPAHGPGPRPPADGGDHVGLDRTAVRVRAHPRLHQPRQRHRAAGDRRAGAPALHDPRPPDADPGAGGLRVLSPP